MLRAFRLGVALARPSGSTAEVVVYAAAVKPAIFEIVREVWGARCRRGLRENGPPA